MSPRQGSTPRQTDCLTVCRKVTLTLTLMWRLLTKEYACLFDCDGRSLAVCMVVGGSHTSISS
jgi:hypothetical protein